MTQYWLKDPFSGALEFGLCHTLRLLSIEQCSAIGAWRGRYGAGEQRNLDRRARAAIAMLRPELRDTPQLDALLAQLRQNAGRTFLETLVNDRIDQSARVQVADPVALERVLDRHPSVIFVAVHMANLGDTMGGALLKATGRSGITVTRPFLNRFRQRLSNKLRQYQNGIVLPPGIGATRQLLRHLQSPGTFVLLHLDEARGKQIHFPTFGRPIPRGSNLSIAIRLAAASGVPLVPVHLQRHPGVRYTLHTCQPLHVPADSNQEEQDVIATQLDRHFTDVIQKQLSDWLQLYYLRV